MVSGFEPIIREIEMQQEMMETPYTQFEFIEGVLSFYFNDVSFSLRKYDLQIKNNINWCLYYDFITFFKKLHHSFKTHSTFVIFFSFRKKKSVLNSLWNRLHRLMVENQLLSKYTIIMTKVR